MSRPAAASSGPDETVAALLSAATDRLDTAGVEAARLEAEVLLAHALDRPRSHLVAWPDKVPTVRERGHFHALLVARTDGTPIAYLTGRREFWSLDLAVTPRTLIPRPETERLVELALERLPPTAHGRVADLGTGSGAIALALASERPTLDVVASDRDPEALRVARDNARRLGLDNVAFVAGDWCRPLVPGRFLAIVSNPPYVAPDDPHLQRGDLRFEPRAALVAAHDGLADLSTIVTAARDRLVPGGHLLLEHGFDQADAVHKMLVDAGYLDPGETSDHAGQPRVAWARAPG